MAQYTHTTRAKFKLDLSELLDDATNVFWTDAELDLFLDQALLTFGAVSNFWQENIFINTVVQQRIYDLFVDHHATENIVPSITIGRLIDWLNADLIEALPTASEFYNLPETIERLETVYDEFQRQTGLVLTSKLYTIVAGESTVELDNNVLDIVRVSYITTDINNDEIESVLRLTDEQELLYNEHETLEDMGFPLYYTNTYDTNKKIHVYPMPAATGQIRIIASVGLDKTQQMDEDSVIPLPDNLVPYLKFGIERDLFNKSGVLKDEARAEYCDSRWKEGITIGRNYNSILLAWVFDRLIHTSSLEEMDLYEDAPLVPFYIMPPTNALGLAGFNIFQVDNLPDVDPSSIKLLCTQNAPLPATNEDFIQVEQGYIKPLLDYCVHCAGLKTGINWIALTKASMEIFLRSAIGHNQRLQMRGITFEKLVQTTKVQEQDKPSLVEVSNG
jgi:hypothetical protein